MTAHIVRFAAAGTTSNRCLEAANDCELYATQLRRVVSQLPRMHHALALLLLSDWRMYCFERNYQRWPDGAFYLLDRGYQFWRGHRIALRHGELLALGVEDWGKRAVRIAYGPGIYPLQAECFHYQPRRQLPRFAQLVGRIAEHLHQGLDGAAAQQGTR